MNFGNSTEWSFGNLLEVRRSRLPKPLIAGIDPARWGHVAEWLRSGLQNRLHQFNSGRGLHPNFLKALGFLILDPFCEYPPATGLLPNP
jgi:hypothetical protein